MCVAIPFVTYWINELLALALTHSNTANIHTRGQVDWKFTLLGVNDSYLLCG